jgi:hypothetical protein
MEQLAAAGHDPHAMENEGVLRTRS